MDNNYVNKQIYDLFVLSKIDNKKQYNCRCICGKELIVSEYDLKTGHKKSCGCRKNRKSYHDLSGEKFGKLLVLSRGPNETMSNGNQSVRYYCKCDCGKIRLVRATSLKNGHSQSCGCSRKESLLGKNLEDLTGQTFGNWVVISRANNRVLSNGKEMTYWVCKCKCGNVKEVSAGSLKSGDSKSCDCLKIQNLIVDYDLTGKRVGKLTVLKKSKNVFKYGRSLKTRDCLCDCGKIINTYENYLVRNSIFSCGCSSNKSYQEYLVMCFLDNNDIKYEKEKTFKTLKGVNGGQLRFDFAIYSDNILICLIECQGIQHYEPNDYFGGEEQFKIQQIHDNLKRDYVEKNNISLIEIPYYDNDYESIEDYLNFLI